MQDLTLCFGLSSCVTMKQVPCSMRDLSSLTGVEQSGPLLQVGAQHWTTGSPQVHL